MALFDSLFEGFVVHWAKLRVVLVALTATALLLGLTALTEGGPVAAQGQSQQSAAERCFERHQFGAQPVDAAKTADGQTVLAQTSWRYHDSIGCYLVLDDTALATLRTAHTDTGTTPDDPDDPPPDPTETTGYTAIAAENHFACAIKADQTIECWGGYDITLLGDESARRAYVPKGEFTAVDFGHAYACAIRADRTIACWGDNRLGQLDAPEGKFTAIAANANNTCALGEDGVVACWRERINLPANVKWR